MSDNGMNEVEVAVKRKRGRPRKTTPVEEYPQMDISSMMEEEQSAPTPKKKRGRPRKTTPVETAVAEEPAPAPVTTENVNVTNVTDESDDLFSDSLLLNDPLVFAVVGKLSAKDVKQFCPDGGMEINATISSLRTLCSMYKIQQKNRIAAGNQVAAFEREGSNIPSSVINVLKLSIDNMMTIEKNYARVIEAVAQRIPVCQWLASIAGIGLKTAAMLVSEIDMSKVSQPSSIAQYMGMNSQNSPTYSVEQIKQICSEAGIVRGKPMSRESLVKVAIMTGRNRKTLVNVKTYDELIKAVRKIPYSKDCKTLLYLISDQFVKQSGPSSVREDGSIKSLYGRIYRQYKAEFSLINESGGYAKQAEFELNSKNVSSAELKSCLESGRLSAAHIDMRARRKALSVFVYHFAVAMFLQFKPGEKITRPYVTQYLGHKDYIEPEVPFEEFFNVPQGGIYVDAPSTERVYDASKYVRRFRKDDVSFTGKNTDDLDMIVSKIL